jgi:taurine dioxygenase
LDTAKAFADLSVTLQDRLRTVTAEHSSRRNFRIHHSDAGRPVHELLEDIADEVPSVLHPAVFKHPFTGGEVLYVNAATTSGLYDSSGNRLSDSVLQEVLELTGQLDPEFRDPRIHLHTFDEGDLVIWDNRLLLHRPLRNPSPGPAQAYRVAMRDDQPFFGVPH